MIDFSIEFPYQIYNQRGIIVEIDGSQYEENIQKTADETEIMRLRKQMETGYTNKTREWHKNFRKLKILQ